MWWSHAGPKGARDVFINGELGFARFFIEAQASDPRTIVEAFEHGWWYTAGLPGGRRVAVCMTDLDLARRFQLRREGGWSRLLDETTQIQSVLRGARPDGSMLVRATESRRLDRVCGKGWLAVGDAASIFDPLSSQGIAKALRSGIFAAYAIGDALTLSDESGLERYRHFLTQEYQSYCRARARQYQAEARWPASAFWRRRGTDSPRRRSRGR